MAFLAGERLPAARLNRIQPIPFRVSQALIQTVTNAEADVNGTSITITTAAPNAVYTVVAVFDFDVTAAASTIATGRLRVDGVTDTASEAHHSGAAVSRDTPGQTWRGVLAAAGNHTFVLRVIKTANVGTITTNVGHTSALITIYEVP